MKPPTSNSIAAAPHRRTRQGSGGQRASTECGVVHGIPELDVIADAIHSHYILLNAAMTQRCVVTIPPWPPTSGSCVGDLRKWAIPLFAAS